MSGFLCHDDVEKLRQCYPAGTRLLLVSMNDPYSKLSYADMGTVTNVDDAGTIHMRWDKGGILGLICGEDEFRMLTPEELSEENASNNKYEGGTKHGL